MNIEKNIKKISIGLLSFVIIMVLGYAIALIYITWPISEYSINKAGVFGDSFGILTSLFSGLAFTGIIITIFLQKEELKLQRKEIKDSRRELAKSADAQTKSSQLSALIILLDEYKTKIKEQTKWLEHINSETHIPNFKKQAIKRDEAKKKLDELTDKKKTIFKKYQYDT